MKYTPQCESLQWLTIVSTEVHWCQAISVDNTRACTVRGATPSHGNTFCNNTLWQRSHDNTLWPGLVLVHHYDTLWSGPVHHYETLWQGLVHHHNRLWPGVVQLGYIRIVVCTVSKGSRSRGPVAGPLSWVALTLTCRSVTNTEIWTSTFLIRLVEKRRGNNIRVQQLEYFISTAIAEIERTHSRSSILIYADLIRLDPTCPDVSSHQLN